MSNDSMDDLIKAMLAANQKNKAVIDQEQQKQKIQEEEMRKLLQAIKYQREHLLNLLSAVIDRFNQQSMPGEKIVVTQKDVTQDSTIYQTVLYTLPNKLKGITLVFFTLDPSLNLTRQNRGFVPLGAYLRGKGSTFLWCHTNNNDRLGNWVVCRMPTSNLNQGDINAIDEEYHFNEKSLRSLEIAQTSTPPDPVHYEEDVRKEFALVLLEAMQAD